MFGNRLLREYYYLSLATWPLIYLDLKICAVMQGRRNYFKQERITCFQCIKASSVKSAEQVGNNNDRKAVRDTLFKSPLSPVIFIIA